VLDADGGLDRQKLAAIVFTDAEARKALEGIIHPHVSRATDQWFASLNAGKHAFAIADVPLLYEVGRDKDFDTVIVAAASPAAQLRRVIDRGLSETEARLRITAQLPIEDKIRRADYVIRTDSTFVETDAQVRKVWETLRSQSTETQLG
jgi:dephospho-CoA kinase